MKSYLFISDIHGFDQKLYEQLNSILNSVLLPKRIFFLGDIVGTENLDKLQKLFYNEVVNYSKKLLQDKPDATDQEIIGYPTSGNKTLSDGVQELWDYLYEPIELDPKFKSEYIRELSHYAHFGHFVSCLPDSIKYNLRKDLETNAMIWLELMSKFIDQGVEVAIVEGNWDARNPLDFAPNKDVCKPLPTQDRDFVFKDFVESFNDKIEYYDLIDAIEEEDKIFILLPFDDVINFDPDIIVSQKTTKKIILVSHTQADWIAIKGDISMTYEGKKINENMKNIISFYKPSAIVHGHLHDPGHDYSINHIPVYYLSKGTFKLLDF